jgi:hypothetical protein
MDEFAIGLIGRTPATPMTNGGVPPPPLSAAGMEELPLPLSTAATEESLPPLSTLAMEEPLLPMPMFAACMEELPPMPLSAACTKESPPPLSALAMEEPLLAHSCCCHGGATTAFVRCRERRRARRR